MSTALYFGQRLEFGEDTWDSLEVADVDLRQL